MTSERHPQPPEEMTSGRSRSPRSSEPTPRARKPRARKWLPRRWIALALVGGVPAATLGSWLAWRSYRLERAMCFPERQTAGAPAEYGLNPAREVAFSSSGATLYGWYLPGENGAAVALFHGAGGHRAALAAEARTLHARGFAVLLAELPGHGRSGGQISWDVAEEQAITSAIDWLERAPGVKPMQLGALGFSLGGYVLARVAARDARLRAVVLASTPAHLADRIRHTHRRWGAFGELFARLAFQRAGSALQRAPAQDVVAGIAPRALLVVTSEQDELVPRSMADTLFAQAQEPKALLVVPGAGHGNFFERSDVYATRLIEFFSRELGLTGLEKTQ